MFSNNQKISLRQLQVLLILDLFGTMIITLPRKVVEYSAQDGWIVVIGIVIMGSIYAFILATLAEMFKEETIVEFGRKLLPSIFYYIVIGGLILKIMISTAMELRVFSEIVTQMLLYNTPSNVIVLSLLLTASYVARKGTESRARLGEILIIFMFVPLIFILISIIFKPPLENILPILKTSKKNIIRGAGRLGFSFHGLEYILLIYPFLKNKKDGKKSIIQAVIILGISMFIITFITIVRFGPTDVSRQIWPVMQLMQAVNIPGSFLERQDAFIISFWILSVFMLVSAGLYFTSIIFSRVTKSTESYHFVLPLVPILYIISLLPRNIVETYIIMDFTDKYFGFAYLFIIPLALIIIAKLKGIKNEN